MITASRLASTTSLMALVAIGASNANAAGALLVETTKGDRVTFVLPDDLSAECRAAYWFVSGWTGTRWLANGQFSKSSSIAIDETVEIHRLPRNDEEWETARQVYRAAGHSEQEANPLSDRWEVRAKSGATYTGLFLSYMDPSGCSMGARMGSQQLPATATHRQEEWELAPPARVGYEQLPGAAVSRNAIPLNTVRSIQYFGTLEEATREVRSSAEKQAANAQEAVKRRKREAVELSDWRRRLKLGDDTFCGPVIEARLPMIKIAVRPQLPGYGSEAWLKASEVFPDSYGCRNVNGRLEPM